MTHDDRRGRRKRLSATLGAALMAGLLALSPSAAAVAAPAAPTITLTWNALSPQAQKSGEQFSYLASLSCQSLSGQACSDVILEMPYAAASELHPAVTPLAEWKKSVSAAVNGVSVEKLSFSDTGQAIVVDLGTLHPGAQANVTLRVVPPARTTAGGTTWTTGLEVRSANASAVRAAAVEMTAEAEFRPSMRKALVDLAPRSRVLHGTTVAYTITLGDVTGGAVGGVGLSPTDSAVVTDVLPDELSFESCSDSCSVEGQKVTWELDQSIAPTTVTVRASVRADAAVDSIFRNTATAEVVSLVGEEASIASNAVEAVVTDAPKPHDVFRKEAVGNLGDTTPAPLGHITAKRPSAYLLKVIGQPVDIEYGIRDSLPCTEKGGSWVSLPSATDELCADPAYVVSSITAQAQGGAVSFPRSATLFYSDGTSDEFVASRDGDIFQVPADKLLSRVEARGTLAARAGTLVYTLTGKPAAFAADDSFRNIAGFTLYGPDGGEPFNAQAELDTHRAVGASIGWQQLPPSSPDLTFRRMADLDPADEGLGFNWSYVGWWPQFFSTPEARIDSGAAAVVLPKGFKIADRNTSKLGVTEDWRGTGQTRYVLSGKDGNVTGAGGPAFNIVIDNDDPANPGLHTYDMFVGFRDMTFDECLLMNGKPVGDSNSLVVDTSGIIGSTEGVETTLCHVQGTLLVLGDDPGIALNKSVRSALSPQWSNAPETVVEIGDDGVAEFLLAWSNPGSTPVDDAVIYDVFPRAGGDVTVTGAPRDSTLPLSLARAPEVSEGWVVEYSMSADPCRPEIRAREDEAGCDDDWTRDLADVTAATAIRFVKSQPADIGDTLLVTLSFTAPEAYSTTAYNTAASAVKLVTKGHGLVPLAPLETPRVGAARATAPVEPDPEPTEPAPEPEPTEPAPDPEPREQDPAPQPEEKPQERTPDSEPSPQPEPREKGNADGGSSELARTGGAGVEPLVGIGLLLVVGGAAVTLFRRLKLRG